MQFVQADVVDYALLLHAFKLAAQFSPTQTIDIVIPSAGLFGPPINVLLPDPSSPGQTTILLTGKTPMADSMTDDPPAPNTSVLDVNFKGVYLTTYLALHYFRKALAANPEDTKPKQILFISSILAYLEAPMNLSYCGSKHGIRGLFRSLRWEGHEIGIPSLQVNLIAPTLMKTPMTKDFWSYLQDVRGFALGMPEEAVELGLRLLCDGHVDGRAVAVVPGYGNVDLCDDFEGSDGARESLTLIREGHLGPGPMESGRFIV